MKKSEKIAQLEAQKIEMFEAYSKLKAKYELLLYKNQELETRLTEAKKRWIDCLNEKNGSNLTIED